jgi:hypothetical protein
MIPGNYQANAGSPSSKCPRVLEAREDERVPHESARGAETLGELDRKMTFPSPLERLAGPGNVLAKEPETRKNSPVGQSRARSELRSCMSLTASECLR